LIRPAGSREFAGLLQDLILHQEENLRALFYAVLLSTAVSAVALADESVSGKWRSNEEGGVVINMNVSPDGNWSSETLQRKKVVRQMRGTYKQTQDTDHTGTLVFTPTKATVKSGKVEVETDQYELADGGKQLKLTADGDTWVFEKH
jgi:hypothetical protein